MTCTFPTTQLPQAALFRCGYQTALACIALLTICTLLAGCSGSGEGHVLDSESGGLQIEEQTNSTAELAVEEKSAYVSRSSLPKHWLPPLNDHDNFFLPPAPVAAAKPTATTEVANVHVRLLGFATVQSTDGVIAKAIMKIADQLVYMKVGDVHADLKVIAIDSQSVSLQRGRERWNVTLMNQPITNAGVPYRSNAASGSTSGTGRKTRTQPFPFPEPGDFPGSRSNGPSGPHSEQQVLNPPAFPELPEIELPEINLPEIPEIDLP